MTADFVQTTISKSAERIFSTEFTNAADYDAIVAEITGAANPLGLASVKLGNQSYKTYVGYFDPATSKMNGKVQVTASARNDYNAAVAALIGSAEMKTAFGRGDTAEASEIDTDATWNVRISAMLGKDTFAISFNREKMVISGYSLETTREAVEAWADTKESLN